MSNLELIKDHASELNHILNNGVAIQPNSLLHEKLKKLVETRKFEVSEEQYEYTSKALLKTLLVLIEANHDEKYGDLNLEINVLTNIINQLKIK